MTLDLDALAAVVAGFAKSHFIAVPGGPDNYCNDAIDAVDDGEVTTLAEVYVNDCAAPIVEILNASAELLRLARVGQALEHLMPALAEMRRGHDGCVSTPSCGSCFRCDFDAAVDRLDCAATKEPT